MSIRKFFNLMIGILVLVASCAGIIVYENNAFATVGASSAILVLPTFTVGSEFTGLITEQDVNVGDPVTVGQPLFELKSDQATAELASGQLTAGNMNYTLAPDGGLLIVARQTGILTAISSLKGSFVTAGSSVATITGTTGASVRSNFELSGPEYAKIQPTTSVEVTIGGNVMNGTISSITQRSVNGHTFTIVDSTLPAISRTQTVYANGAPASSKLVLDTHTYYRALVAKLGSVRIFGHAL